MKPKEAKRVNVAEQLVQGTITVSQAARLLCLSERQVKRIKKGVKNEGLTYLVHKNRGSKPKHAISEDTRREVVKLALTEFKGASCSHMAELLEDHRQILISPRSIRRILAKDGIANVHSQKAPRRRGRRERMPQEGMLAQIDASPFLWLEDRGPEMSLHGVIDDASGKVLGLRFEQEECLSGYMHVLRQTAENEGIPRQFYSDRHTIFFSPNKDKLSIEEELAGKKAALTQFGRILDELGASQIPAYSPQAKGRVERLWRTLQHRLMIEMRIANICSLDEANDFLQGFIKKFNKQFAVKPADPLPAYLPTPADPDTIICIKNKRKASNGSTVSYLGQTYQLLKENGSIALLRPGSTVQVLTHLNGFLSALYEGNRFSVQVCTKADPVTPAKTCEKPKSKTKPADNHPWRNTRTPKPIASEIELYVKKRCQR